MTPFAKGGAHAVAWAVVRHAHRAHPAGDILRGACVCGHPSSGGRLSRRCEELRRVTQHDTGTPQEAAEALRVAADAWDATGRYFVEGRELRPGDILKVYDPARGRRTVGHCIGAAEGPDGVEAWVAVCARVGDHPYVVLASGGYAPTARGVDRPDAACWCWAAPAM